MSELVESGMFPNHRISATITPDTYVYPTASKPVTVVLTGVLLFVIAAGFISLFFWRFLLYRLFSALNLQQTPYNDLIHVTTPPQNTGLDPLIIQSFPTFLYSSPTTKSHITECSICLTEFSNEDTVRLVTICNHLFHSNCIDRWFELHKTCPVCRCELDPEISGSESFEFVHNTVTLNIQDEENPPLTSSSKRLTEGLDWRLSRSHSTGHFVVEPMDVNVKINRSCVTFDELSRFDEAVGNRRWIGYSSYFGRIVI